MEIKSNKDPKNKTCNYSGLPSTESYSWIDEENSDYDSFSDGRDKRGKNTVDDSNEY
tara:strand:- start:432 stop:602 length:171 start_codon:yes stop_codon:yes gene_type:complete